MKRRTYEHQVALKWAREHGGGAAEGKCGIVAEQALWVGDEGMG